MKNRKWILGIAIVLLLLMVGVIGWRLSARSRINETNFDRIELGMTEAEVESLLGGPADEYNYECFLGGCPDDGVGGYWYGTDHTIYVSFHQDTAVEKRLRPPGRELSHDNWWWSTRRRLNRCFGI